VSDFNKKNVLITGGLGFIGSNLAIKLVTLGANVTIVDSLIWAYGGNWFNIEPIKDKVKVIVADIRDRNILDELVTGKDYIFNLAGQVSHIDSMEDPLTDMDINTRSQLSILESCRKNNPGVKIVYASSRQIYGKPQYLPVDEKHPLAPTDVNGINKMAGEWYHILYNNVHGIKAVCLRLTNVYGPRQLMKHDRQGFIGWFVRLAVEGGVIRLYGDGTQKRDLNYVDDVVDAILKVVLCESCFGQVFNLGHKEHSSLKDIAEKLVNITGKGRIEFMVWPEEKKKIDIGDYFSDFTKISKAINWEPKISLEIGFSKTLDYYEKNLRNYL
jgi:UDP-glucose 4-epimerase